MKSFRKGYDGMLLRFVLLLVKCFMYTIFRLRVHGKENLPSEGPIIVALNHKSFWDPVLAISVLPRRLNFMAKKELFNNPILGGILKWAGAFPVARGTSDLGAIKTSLSILRAGKALAIFPEGTRVKNDQPHAAKAGVAMIAEKTGAPIVPVAIAGKYRFLSKVDLYIGEPVSVKSQDGTKLSGEELQKISDTLMEQILHMAGQSTKPMKKENDSWISK